MKEPLISVVVPVYNVEKYLNKCVESIVKQTYGNLEIIVVDDGSPDNCPRICDEWAARDNRIKVIHLENAGVANARNTALRQAHCDYIAFVDGDDYIEPDMYAVLLDTALKYNSDITFCSYQINDEDRGAAACSEISKADAMKQLVTGAYKYGVLWNKLYRCEIIKEIEMADLVYSEDLVYNYYAFKNADGIAENQLKLYHYYQNESSAVHKQFNRKNYDAVIARKIILEDISSSDLRESALYGYILSLFVFLNSIIETDCCTDMAESVRKEILNYKNEIRKKGVFSKTDKMKTVLLSLSYKAYKAAFQKLK